MPLLLSNVHLNIKSLEVKEILDICSYSTKEEDAFLDSVNRKFFDIVKDSSEDLVQFREIEDVKIIQEMGECCDIKIVIPYKTKADQARAQVLTDIMKNDRFVQLNLEYIDTQNNNNNNLAYQALSRVLDMYNSISIFKGILTSFYVRKNQLIIYGSSALSVLKRDYLNRQVSFPNGCYFASISDYFKIYLKYYEKNPNNTNNLNFDDYIFIYNIYKIKHKDFSSTDLAPEIEDIISKNLFCQNGETKWMFLKRISNFLNAPLFVSPNQMNTCFMGIHPGKIDILESLLNIKLKIDRLGLSDVDENVRSPYRLNHEEQKKVSTSEYFIPIGTKVQFVKDNYDSSTDILNLPNPSKRGYVLVKAVTIVNNDGFLETEYTCKRISDIGVDYAHNYSMQGSIYKTKALIRTDCEQFYDYDITNQNQDGEISENSLKYIKRLLYVPGSSQYFQYSDKFQKAFIQHNESDEASAVGVGGSIDTIRNISNIGYIVSNPDYSNYSGVVVSELGSMVSSIAGDSQNSDSYKKTYIHVHENSSDGYRIDMFSSDKLEFVSDKTLDINSPIIEIDAEKIHILQGQIKEDNVIADINNSLINEKATKIWSTKGKIVDDSGSGGGGSSPARPGGNTSSPNVPPPGGPGNTSSTPASITTPNQSSGWKPDDTDGYSSVNNQPSTSMDTTSSPSINHPKPKTEDDLFDGKELRDARLEKYNGILLEKRGPDYSYTRKENREKNRKMKKIENTAHKNRLKNEKELKSIKKSRDNTKNK